MSTPTEPPRGGRGRPVPYLSRRYRWVIVESAHGASLLAFLTAAGVDAAADVDAFEDAHLIRLGPEVDLDRVRPLLARWVVGGG